MAEFESFNSRSREGSDEEAGVNPALALSFQFTLPRGERLARISYRALDQVFQFTLPRGERRRESGSVDEVAKFQFTLPRGERHGVSDADNFGYNVSIHAPARGATSFDKGCFCS